MYFVAREVAGKPDHNSKATDGGVCVIRPLHRKYAFFTIIAHSFQ